MEAVKGTGLQPISQTNIKGQKIEGRRRRRRMGSIFPMSQDARELGCFWM